MVILGYFFVFVTVIGGYLLSDGKLTILFQPAEFLIIVGAALGAFLVGNNRQVIIKLVSVFPILFRKSRYSKEGYIDILTVNYLLLTKARQQGNLSLESDIDEPQRSTILLAYPRIISDTVLLNFMLDYFRLTLTGNIQSHEMQLLMDEEIATHEQEGELGEHALSATGDALPAFGIVAAVMGVINTLAGIDRSMAEIGESIAHAMVGTFLGILLAYGFILPLASLLRQKNAEQIKALQCIKAAILANLQGYAPRIAIEFARKVLFSDVRPSFLELEEHARKLKISLASGEQESPP